MKKFTSAFGRLFLSAVLIFLVFYTMMPAINLHDQDFICHGMTTKSVLYS